MVGKRRNSIKHDFSIVGIGNAQSCIVFEMVKKFKMQRIVYLRGIEFDHLRFGFLTIGIGRKNQKA